MIFGDLVGLKLPDSCLKGEKNPEKKPHPGNLSRPVIEPGPASVRRLPPAPQRWTNRDTIYNILKRCGSRRVSGNNDLWMISSHSYVIPNRRKRVYFNSSDRAGVLTPICKCLAHAGNFTANFLCFLP